MRRVSTTLIAMVVLLSLALPASATEPVPTFLDTFSEQAFGGNDGTLEFNGPWMELGESDGPESGLVRVWNHEYCHGAYCVKMGGSDEDARLHGTYRAIDLTGAASAKLSFDDGRQLLDDESAGIAVVQVSPDGGDTWKTLDTINLDTDDGKVSFHGKYTITDFATSDTVIRFKITESENLDAYWIVDNVTVDATFDSPPTTTTSTTKAPKSTTTTTTTAPEPTTTTTTTRAPKPTTTTTTSAPEPTTSTTSPRVAVPAPPQPTTTTTSGSAILGSGIPPESRKTMMTKTALAVPSASGVNAMSASMILDPSSQRNQIEPIEMFAAAFLTESGSYGQNLLPAIVLGVVIAAVSLKGIDSRRED